MKDKNRLQIAFCGNDLMFDGLYLCILSILRRTKSNIDFYLLTGNLKKIKSVFIPLTKRHIQAIKNLINKYNKKSNFKVIDCAKFYLDKTQNYKLHTRRWTPYALFRLFINKIGFKGVLLYLDIDILVSQDIKKAFNVDMKNYELCVCHDTPKVDWNNGKYFNSGSMLINCDLTKKTKLFEKAFDFCLNNNPKFPDQTALNHCWTKIKFWKNEYCFNCQPDCDHTNAVIHHFCGKDTKPWETKKFLKKLWRKNIHIWDDDYILFNSLKNKVNK